MHRQAASSRTSYAFTLVELLVVILIIAVIASILFPVFASVRKRADNTVCVANLRQIGMAMALYTADYDGQYPFACSPEDIVDPERSFLPPELLSGMVPYNVVLEPYVHNKPCWRCPLDTQQYFEQYGTSYMFNEYLDEPKVVFDPDISKVPLAFDGSIDWHTVNPADDTNLDYVNVIFADLHASRATWYDTTIPHI